MTPDVPAFFAELGVTLPDRRGSNVKNVKVSCFANAGAHKRMDKKPSCSVNVETGAWNCFVCKAKGNAYQAALAHGRTAAEAMQLLEKHGLHEPRKRAATQKTSKSTEQKDTEPSGDAVSATTEEELRRCGRAVPRWNSPIRKPPVSRPPECGCPPTPEGEPVCRPVSPGTL